MEYAELKKSILTEVEKKYRINSYRKVVDNIIDIAIKKVQETK